ncbi:MAG: kynureninase [Deltaproteobacteria bacterium]|nr:kynureninase [Deltaproteobacteria bacterium]
MTSPSADVPALTSRTEALELDARDPLAPLGEQFELPEGVIYLDGNSLGALPRAAPARLARVLREEWGAELIRSWNTAGWIELPARVGDKIARLIGAGPGEVVAADSTSINLYKVLWAAAGLQRSEAPARRVIVSEDTNFPTDLYVAASLCRELDCRLEALEADALPARLAHGDDVAVLLLTHVNYRTGRMHDLAGLTAAAHACGALAVWDLAHSAGAVPVDLRGAGADFAVGCGYKYLNGGPGAPAFVWAAPRHAASARQPLSGWMGHAAPFRFAAEFEPAAGVARFLCGTPPILAMAALECGVDTVLAAEPLGGMSALRARSLRLTGAFAALVDRRAGAWDLRVVSPREPERRGSQVCLVHDAPGGHAYGVVQALTARGVVGDFRAGEPGPRPSPDILRFGFSPLYTRFVDVWDAVERLAGVMASREYEHERFRRRAAVT